MENYSSWDTGRHSLSTAFLYHIPLSPSEAKYFRGKVRRIEMRRANSKALMIN
jgi:hypothetical protein